MLNVVVTQAIRRMVRGRSNRNRNKCVYNGLSHMAHDARWAMQTRQGERLHRAIEYSMNRETSVVPETHVWPCLLLIHIVIANGRLPVRGHFRGLEEMNGHWTSTSSISQHL